MSYKGVETEHVNRALHVMYPDKQLEIEDIDIPRNDGGYSKVYDIKGWPDAVLKLGVYTRTYDNEDIYKEGCASFHTEINLLERYRNEPACVYMYEGREIKMGDKTMFLLVLRKYSCVGDMAVSMKEEQVRKMAKDLLPLLINMHKDQVYHRDIKPDNIFYLNGSYYLGDFGAAKDVKNNLGLIRDAGFFSKIGSEFYAAPEIAAKKYDGKVDVYSLGMTMLDVLSDLKMSDIKNVGTCIEIPCKKELKKILRKATIDNPANRLDSTSMEQELTGKRSKTKTPAKFYFMSMLAVIGALAVAYMIVFDPATFQSKVESMVAWTSNWASNLPIPYENLPKLSPYSDYLPNLSSHGDYLPDFSSYGDYLPKLSPQHVWENLKDWLGNIGNSLENLLSWAEGKAEYLKENVWEEVKPILIEKEKWLLNWIKFVNNS